MKPRELIRFATIFYVLLALGAWGWAALFDLRLFGELPVDAPALGHGALVGLLIVVICHVCHRLFRSVRDASAVLGEFLGPIGWATALWLALISGFAEELCFRGALWPQMGLVGTSVFFGLCHTVPMRALLGYPIFAFFVGLLFGMLREKSGSVWSPVAAHVTVNALNLAWLGARQRVSATLPVSAPSRETSSVDVSIPEDFDVPDTFPATIWRYDLRVEPAGTDRENLPMCLEGEQLELFQYVDREKVYEALREGLFVFAESFSSPLAGFPVDVAAFSAYLFQPIVGVEVAERYVDERTTDDVRAWKIVAQRGEWVKVPLVVSSPEPGKFLVDPDEEDLGVLSAHWAEYPRWFQDGMRFKHPSLRDL